MMRGARPDLVIVGGDLTDMSREAFCQTFRNSGDSPVPLMALGAQMSRSQRLSALRAGADDALSTPLAEAPFLARIRCLLRAQSTIEALRHKEIASPMPGLAEDPQAYDMPSSVVLAAPDGADAVKWSARLKPLVPYRMRALPIGDTVRSMSLFAVPDAYVIGVNPAAPEEDLRLLAEIRARTSTRQAAVLIVLSCEDETARVHALDLGANDVVAGSFDAEEAALRLAAALKRKKLTDRLSHSIEMELNAAVTDPLTGLYNRRYALPQLKKIARHACATDQDFAVMVADLDHFKRVNDTFGHSAGDVVLAEVARRLRTTLQNDAVIARIGGEEFLIVIPNTDTASASDTAHKLCNVVRQTPVYLRARDIRIDVTISVGVTMGRDFLLDRDMHPADVTAGVLIDQADRALYDAKACGRDSVTMTRPAA